MGRLFQWDKSLLPDLLRRCVAEVIGTWLLVFAGTAVVAAAVLAGAQVGLWQVAVGWALGVSLAIYLTAGFPGPLNPSQPGLAPLSSERLSPSALRFHMDFAGLELFWAGSDRYSTQ